MDIITGVFREFGWELGGGILAIFAAAVTIRVLASRIETLYEKRIADITTAHTQRVESILSANEKHIALIKEGHANEIAALRVHSEKGWTSYEAMRVQAERLADRYADTTELARDMADELLDRRRTRRATGR